MQTFGAVAVHGQQRRGNLRQHHAGGVRLRRRRFRAHQRAGQGLHTGAARQAEGVSEGDS